MNFLDGSLFPENQQKLVITAAPYGPEWMPADFPQDIPVSMAAQIQKAVDCYNAGATVLHLHVRELDGTGSKRLSKFNELLAGIRARVPELILQVGGSISFAPEGSGEVARWLSDDTRHMLAELQPTPDQVTIAINTNQMNIVEQMCDADLAGTSIAQPDLYRAYREMTIPAGPEWVEEHIRRHHVPLHPLYERGYTSIGCAPVRAPWKPAKTSAPAAGGGSRTPRKNAAFTSAPMARCAAIS